MEIDVCSEGAACQIWQLRGCAVTRSGRIGLLVLGPQVLLRTCSTACSRHLQKSWVPSALCSLLDSLQARQSAARPDWLESRAAVACGPWHVQAETCRELPEACSCRRGCLGHQAEQPPAACVTISRSPWSRAACTQLSSLHDQRAACLQAGSSLRTGLWAQGIMELPGPGSAAWSWHLRAALMPTALCAKLCDYVCMPPACVCGLLVMPPRLL